MTIREILDTPITEIWSVLSPFVIGYSIFSVVIFLLAFSFIGYVAVQVFKGHRNFNKRRK